MDSVLEFIYPKLILFVFGFWSSVCTYFLRLLRCFTRFTKNGGSLKGTPNDSKIVLTESMEENNEFLEFASKEIDEKETPEFASKEIDEKETPEFASKEIDEINEKETPEFAFSFKFPTYDEFSSNQKDLSQFLNLVEPSSVLEEKVSEFVNLNEVSFEASEVDTNSIDGFVLDEGQDLDFQKRDDDEKEDDFEDQECVHEQKIMELEEKEEIDASSEEKLQKVHDEIDSNDIHSPTNDLEEKEVINTSNEENLQKVDDKNTDSIDSNDGFLSDFDFNFEQEFNEKEQNNPTKSNFLSEDDFGEKPTNDTTNKLESLWEHQELIEQLKMEIKKVKAIGLPTIFEESESPPKIMEELKPWKIEEVYNNGGNKMNEVHKFYKSYRERMRKFDIFSYQKMYAIGFLQLKDPTHSSSSSNSSIPEITTLLTQSFTTNKNKKHENDPTIKFIKELQSDLEVVYVGQMCLSWEILHWQYEKALDIWESDPRGVRRFNEIAGEFQQFQVLMQRFIEDEAFQGPRSQNYVKNRCVFRNLLQVPVIRDDHSKNRKMRNEVVCDITSDTLVEIMEESIRIFWQFVRADKYKRQTPVELQRPEDTQLFMDLQKDLHKKERKVKEHMRSGNSLLKKLRSCREDETEDQVLYFFCQVDMRLVSRVLQMSRLTNDQLVWCQNKLSKVSFVNRKIHVEPSFLLFPC